MIKIIFTDMDGTFLDSKGSYNKRRFRAVFQKMREQNVIFAPCSGKQCERIEELFGSFARDFYIIGDSAARIKHKGKYIYEKLLDSFSAEKIINFFAKYDVSLICCTQDAAFVKDGVSEEDFRLIRNSYSVLRKIKNYSSLRANLVKISIYDKKKRGFDMAEGLKKYEGMLHIIASEAEWIDITHKEVNKGAAAKWLMRKLHFKCKEAVAFGDSYNDADLLDEVEYGFCVSNAVEKLKEKALFVTKSNDEEAVLKASEFILELQGGIYE